MAIRRALRRGAGEEETDESIGQAAIRIYKLLHTGEYEDALGRRVPVRGDISQITKIIGLKNTEKAILAIFLFSCSGGGCFWALLLVIAVELSPKWYLIYLSRG